MRRALIVTLFLAAPALAEPPRIAVLDAPGVTAACESGLARTRQALERIEAGQEPATFFDEWNRLQIGIEDAFNPLSVLRALHPDKAVRDAAEACQRQVSAIGTEIYQSEKLFRRLEATKPANPRQQKLRKDLREGFEDSGVALPAEKRARAKDIYARLTELQLAFTRNIANDARTVRFTAEELEGVPERFLASRKRDAEGGYALGTDDATFSTVMMNARREETRKRLYVARFNKGGEQNLALLEEGFRLRRELANLYGLPTYAHFATRRKMAGSPEAVNKFLGEVKAAFADREKVEVAELSAAKARETGQPPGQTRLERWDVQYFQERVRRERFDVDQEKLRRYFPTDKSVQFAMRVAETLYGIRFREVDAPKWHEDVRCYDVADAKSGRYMATVYLDLYPRDGKRNGAWAQGVRRASTLEGRTPLSTLATNFNREGLSQRELATLLHEFGHVLHNILSDAQYASQAGTSVKRDFVEAPSQMFEEWARRQQSLALFAKVCPECPVLTPEQIERLEAARRYGRGMHYSGQWLLASFDMALSTDPQPPLEVWNSLEGETLLGSVQGTIRPASFAHIAGSGYAAGYYGYMWSEAIALELLGPFKPNLLDPRVGARYRETILGQGGQDEEMNLVRKFLGREPSTAGFFKDIAAKR